MTKNRPDKKSTSELKRVRKDLLGETYVSVRGREKKNRSKKKKNET